MSDFDIDDDDDIDWDEAALIAEASVPSPAPVLAAESIVIASDHEAAVAAATTTTTTTAAPPQLAESHPKQQDEEELLILYDLLARADADDASAELVDDIEDLMVSSAAATGAGGAARRASRTLYDQFRKRRGFLLVTDLTAPGGWCEVQYSYSLLGRRDLKPEARPEKIVTAAGKEIKVDKKIAIAHEKVLEKGRQVHKVLEREVHPEQVYVRTTSKADKWGLRILNQIVSLVTLRDAGKAREIPVFGFVKDVFVIGVLDEIERRVLPGQEKEGTDASNQADSEKISFYFQSKSPAKPLQTGLFLVDSKTRRSRSKPRAEHTVASRFQLMLYKTFFDMHARSQFDWQRFYAHVALHPTEQFSTSFLEQTRVICEGLGADDATKATTLGDMTNALSRVHAEMGPLQDQLELVYRMRGDANAPRMWRPDKKKARQGRRGGQDASTSTAISSSSSAISITVSSDEDEDLQRAIAASLINSEALSGVTSSSQTDAPSAPALASQVAAPPSASICIDLTSDEEAVPSLSKPLAPAATPKRRRTESMASTAKATPPSTQEIAARAQAVRAEQEGSIIGTETFQHDATRLEAYLELALSFWHGRAPIGVAIDETNKCRSCEFSDGCEWLESKATEERQKAVAKRQQREAVTQKK